MAGVGGLFGENTNTKRLLRASKRITTKDGYVEVKIKTKNPNDSIFCSSLCSRSVGGNSRVVALG